MSAGDEEETAAAVGSSSAGDGSSGTAATAAERIGATELVVVARAAKTRGLRGEIAAELLTDFPERFEAVEELIAVDARGGRKLLALEDHWLQGGRVVLKFAGYDTPDEAAALLGCDFAVPESEAVELEEGEFYDWQLEGCRVETIDNQELGTVREVLHTGSAPILVIRGEGAGAREHLVPLVEAICVRVDIVQRLIRVDAPEGLLAL